jgi:serine/threonine-protein kinase
MGTVYLALDQSLGKKVALKILNTNLAGQEGLLQRFEREVAVCAALNSNHIVQVTDSGATDGYPFYVMEYLQGQTLGQLMRREKRLTPERAVPIIKQLCAGLSLAHQGVVIPKLDPTQKIKVVHRDLKPDNIFLVPSAIGEMVKILDFGIVKVRDTEATDLTSDGFLGTSRYASPEQLESRADIDQRSDIYSIGLIFYEMLSGSNPFNLTSDSKTTFVQWYNAHLNQEPKPLQSQPGCQHIAPEIALAIQCCLAKEPDQRFASVEVLAKALDPVFPLDETVVS